ncbi:hypothetical protein WJX84_003733 [Apatococcus fuscideae]|uniref:Stc1 domain-containing protein n=1 Tax=Apatococcus fuscideae TaxID=2026836 RepID=A0AAW1T1T2_9CHLO
MGNACCTQSDNDEINEHGIMECAACGRVAAKPLARMSPVERKQWQHRGSQSVCRTCAEKAARSRQSLDQLLERTSSAASSESGGPLTKRNLSATNHYGRVSAKPVLQTIPSGAEMNGSLAYNWQGGAAAKPGPLTRKGKALDAR